MDYFQHAIERALRLLALGTHEAAAEAVFVLRDAVDDGAYWGAFDRRAQAQLEAAEAQRDGATDYATDTVFVEGAEDPDDDG